MPSLSTFARDRAAAALWGVAIGDAMGMPTQTLDREQRDSWFGVVDDFLDAPDAHPVSAGLKAGTVTDDTEQTLLLARHLITRSGCFDYRVWADELLEWEAETRARGCNDLLGPSTKRAIDDLKRGVPANQTGLRGTTNGAAMRIAPVAIAAPSKSPVLLANAVEETCLPTHNTSEAIGAANAVAAFVSAALDGASLEEALSVALDAARLGERRGAAATEGSIGNAIDRALHVSIKNPNEPRDTDRAVRIADRIGNGVAAVESVPMAFAILRIAEGDPWRAAVLSSNIGGDTDTIGAISCCMASAVSGLAAIPGHAIETVTTINALEIEPIADALLKIRHSRNRKPDEARPAS